MTEGGGCLAAAHHRGRRLPCGCAPRRLPCGWAPGRKARCTGLARTVVRRSSTRRACVTMSLAPKLGHATSGLFARFPKAFFCVLTNPFWGSICTCAFSRGNRHILDVGRPTFFFSCGLYSSLERSSVPPLSGRFSQVRAREGGLKGRRVSFSYGNGPNRASVWV